MHVLFVVVVVVAAVVHWGGAESSSESHEDFGDVTLGFAKNRDQCIKQLGLTEEEFKMNGDPTWKVTHCMMEKDGTIGPDGKFSAERTMAQIQSFWKSQPDRVANATKVVAACRPELEAETATGEALAKKILECFLKHDASARPPSTPATTTM